MKIKIYELKLIGISFMLLLTFQVKAFVLPDSICKYSGTVLHDSTMGDCWYIGLDDGTNLIPVSGVDDSYLIAGLRVRVNYYSSSDTAHVCEFGVPAIIDCITRITDSSTCKVDFHYSRSKMGCPDSVMADCISYAFHFFIDGSDSISQVKWIFNLKDTVFERNPVYTFPGDGIYSVCVEVVYESGCVASHCERIEIGDIKCFADFEYFPLSALHTDMTVTKAVHDSSQDPVYDAQTYYFMDASKGKAIKWLWKFSDDSVYHTKTVVHKFIESGWHKVCLTIVTEDSCESNTCKEIFIEPVKCSNASFWYSHADSCLTDPVFSDSDVVPGPAGDSLIWENPGCDLAVKFYNTSRGDINEVHWDFGDSTTSTVWSPLHKYKEYGEYVVVLKIKGDSCSDEFRLKVILKNKEICKADFEYCNYASSYDSLNTTTDGYLIGFKNHSSGELKSQKWNFGDGTGSTDKNPIHKYRFPGLYTVCLTVYGELGCFDETCKTVVVGSDCDIDFDWEVFYPECSDFMPAYSFEVKSTLPIVYSFWDFGDGSHSYEKNPVHVFETFGEYEVCLTVQQSNGCRTRICKYVNQHLDSIDQVYLKKCGTTAINELKNVDKIQLKGVYPQPAHDFVNFKIQSAFDEKLEIYLYDMIGNVRIAQQVEATVGYNEFSINVNGLNKGNYVYKIISGNDILHGKLMVR